VAEDHVPLAPVVSLDEYRPHLSGKARCLSCLHEWQAVAPVPTTWMECPECGCEHGRFVAQIEQDGPHWHCACGNDLFYRVPEGWYCPMCGLYHEL